MRYILPLLLCIATSAQAQAPKGKYLPPEEFDHPYKGTLEIITVHSSGRVRASCPLVTFIITPLACNIRYGEERCQIFMAPDDIIRSSGFDPTVVLRHEIGHCNGWGADHKGAR